MGPSIGLLTQRPVDIAYAVRLASEVGSWQAGEEVGDGWIEDRPLLIAHESAYLEDYAPGTLRAFEERLGWIPCEQELFVAAGCNRPVDHLLLARVLIHLCDGLSAGIDYGGAIGHAPSDLPGWVLPVSYAVEPGEFAVSTVVSARWLEAWAQQPGFFLPK